MLRERRRHDRHAFYRLIEVRIHGDTSRTIARARDVSLSGVCFETEAPLPLGTQVRLMLPAPGSTGVVVHATVRHVRRTETGYLIGAERVAPALSALA
jgi:hypothetical protein